MKPTKKPEARKKTPLRKPAKQPYQLKNPPKSLNDNQPQRLNKLMAAKGICSRREADYFIQQGWVKVDGQRNTELGSKFLPNCKIELLGQAKNTLSKKVTILYHKPIGVVSAQSEGKYRAALEMIGPNNQFLQDKSPPANPFSPAMLKGLAPAGRLDIDSTGLLVLTQDGKIARQLIDENSTVEKEYLVRVEGTGIKNAIESLRFGLSLDGKALKPATVTWQNDDQLLFILTEGKKRQIRRMCEAVGFKVTGLKRVRIGRIKLSTLPLGQWRVVKNSEAF